MLRRRTTVLSCPASAFSRALTCARQFVGVMLSNVGATGRRTRRNGAATSGEGALARRDRYGSAADDRTRGPGLAEPRVGSSSAAP